MRPDFSRVPLLLSGLLVAALLGACAGDGTEDPANGPCRGPADCAATQSCIAGACLDNCRTPNDCESGFVCTSGTCRPDAGTPDAGTDADDASDDAATDVIPDTDDADLETGDDVVPDLIDDELDTAPDPDVDWGPLTWTIDPARNSTGVALDTDIVITFNQPMNAFRFIPSNLQFRAFEGELVARSIDYDDTTFELTLSRPAPENLLRPATPYTLRLSEFIASESGLDLGRAQSASFATVDYEGEAFREQLARAYGPVIYQQLSFPHIDTFTRFDFDGDQNPSNNFDARRRLTANPAHVYYAVTETPSHFFITYMLYWPGTELRADVFAEHDTLGLMVVVARTAEPLGRLAAWSVMHRDRLTRYGLETSAYPTGANVGTGIDIRVPLADLEGQRRPPIFIQDRDHAPCLPTRSVGRCLPNTGASGPFVAGKEGYVYRPGDVAERPRDNADDNLTYRLLPFTGELWVKRNRTDGDDAIFGGLISYIPPRDGEAERPGVDLRLPASFNGGATAQSYGNLPFSYASENDPPGTAGHWFVDPAWYLSRAIAFEGTFATNYCFNPWLDIDERGRLTGCTAPDFVIED